MQEIKLHWTYLRQPWVELQAVGNQYTNACLCALACLVVGIPLLDVRIRKGIKL